MSVVDNHKAPQDTRRMFELDASPHQRQFDILPSDSVPEMVGPPQQWKLLRSQPRAH